MFSIVIAEDNKDIRESLDLFFCNEGFTVFTAENGLTAWNLARLNRPDFVLSDIKMPVMGGTELKNYLRETPETKNIPVLLMTSDKDIAAADEYPEEILYKPFDLMTLLNIVYRKILMKKLKPEAKL